MDIADLLKDNLEAEICQYLHESESRPYGQTPYCKKEVPDMLNWLNCVSLYATVVKNKYRNNVDREQNHSYNTVVRNTSNCTTPTRPGNSGFIRP